MKNFLAIYTGSADSRKRSGWDAMDTATRSAREAAGVQAWGDWMQQHAKSIVVEGGPLGRTKRASAQGIEDVTNEMAAFVVVRAESHDAAARMFDNHPHFAIFPGDGVEIMECLPIPGN